MNIILKLLALVLLSIGSLCAAQDIMNSPSLLQILSNPEKYDGQEVQVIGFLNLEFEGNALYLRKEDYEHGLLGNMVWIDVKEGMPRPELSRKYVIIRGIYSAKDRGHMGLFTGTIRQLSRCDTWSDPSKPRR